MKFLKNKLKSEKGAMDKVLVTLLFAVIGIAGVVGLYDWSKNKESDLLTKANTEYMNAVK